MVSKSPKMPDDIEFIDENGGGPGVRLRKRQPKMMSLHAVSAAAGLWTAQAPAGQPTKLPLLAIYPDEC